MIVCLCNGITESQIRESIRAGNWDCTKVGIDCGAGSGCGACCKEICKMVDEEKIKRLLDAADKLINNADANLDEVRKAIGEFTVNDILDLVSKAVTEEEEEPGDEELQ